jgi:hypothetical protein
MWVVEVEKDGQSEAATVFVMAKDVHGALKAVERRYPEMVRPGNKGTACLCDHAVFRPASRRFEYKRLRSF